MKTFIALYRGINVGGNNPVKMEALRALHTRLGHADVKTYIQSGNVVFRADGTTSTIVRDATAAFAKQFCFTPALMVCDGKQWSQFVAGNPYARHAAVDPTKVHAAICDGTPDKKRLAELLQKTGGPETFTIAKGILYLHAPNGVGQSKFAAGLERACAVPITMRNWRTIEALDSLAQTLA